MHMCLTYVATSYFTNRDLRSSAFSSAILFSCDLELKGFVFVNVADTVRNFAVMFDKRIVDFVPSYKDFDLKT